MARYPCDVGNHRYLGPQRSIYYSSGTGRQMLQWKQRLCREHFDDQAAYFRMVPESMVEAEELTNVCEDCGQPRTLLLFVTAYPGGDEALMATAEKCPAHGSALLRSLGSPN